MSESKLRTLSMDIAVEIIELVKYFKSKHETIIANQIGRSITSIRVMLIASCCTAKQNAEK